MADDTSIQISRKSISRRAFLRSACVAGVALVGLEGLRPALALGDRPVHSPARPSVALAYWDGQRLVDASRLSAGDSSLDATGVRISIRPHAGAVRTLFGLSALYRVDAGGLDLDVPFHAWTASPHGAKPVGFNMPATEGRGLRLSIDHTGASAGERVASPCRLETGLTPGQPKLRAGTYVLACAGIDLQGYRLVEENGGARLAAAAPSGRHADFDHLILTIQSA